MVTVATDCADQQVATLSYSDVTVPSAPGTFAFPASFTPAGSAAIPFVDANTFVVSAAPLASLTLSPSTSTIAAGASQTYTVQGFDALGNAVTPDPTGTRYTITPDGTCTDATCTATTAGVHTVTVKDKGIAATATLTVGAAPTGADVAVTQTVSTASPIYYGDVSFTTTVTNTSTVATAQGVAVAVAIPSGVLTPAVDPSGLTTFSSSTGVWTIGELAPGAHATLTVSGVAGDVALGGQSLIATATSTTTDPNPTNNTASATETSQPADINVTITPDPGNPANGIPLGVPGTVSWTASVANATNPAAPVPVGALTWTCFGSSGLYSCPDTPALDPTLNLSTLTFESALFQHSETYFLTATFNADGSANNGNYRTDGFASTVTVLVVPAG